VLKILFTKQDDLLNTNQFLNKPKLLEQIRITIILFVYYEKIIF